MSGILGETKIKCSEIRVKGADKRSPVFNGLFFVAEFNQAFSGITVALSNRAQKFWNDSDQSLQKLKVPNGKLIDLKDGRFNKMFVVYGSNQISASHIFSPALMQRISFQMNHRRHIRLCFSGNKLYAAIAFDREPAGPRLADILHDFSKVQEYYDDMKLIIDVVEELNQDQKQVRQIKKSPRFKKPFSPNCLCT